MADILRAQAQRAEATEVNSFEQQLAGLRNLQTADKEDTNVKEIKRKYADEAKENSARESFELPPEEEMDEKQKRFFEED